MSENIRELGYLLLQDCLKNQSNLEVVESALYSTYGSNTVTYLDALYEVHCLLEKKVKVRTRTKSILQEIVRQIKSRELLSMKTKGSFLKEQNAEHETDLFLENPLVVVEGALECICGSKKVFSYQVQTRSNDETATTFAQCSVCKKSWVYSG